MYIRDRYYDPATGQFTRTDLIGLTVNSLTWAEYQARYKDVHDRTLSDRPLEEDPFRDSSWARMILPGGLYLDVDIRAAFRAAGHGCRERECLVMARHRGPADPPVVMGYDDDDWEYVRTETVIGHVDVEVFSPAGHWALIAPPEGFALLGGASSSSTDSLLRCPVGSPRRAVHCRWGVRRRSDWTAVRGWVAAEHWLAPGLTASFSPGTERPCNVLRSCCPPHRERARGRRRGGFRDGVPAGRGLAVRVEVEIAAAKHSPGNEEKWESLSFRTSLTAPGSIRRRKTSGRQRSTWRSVQLGNRLVRGLSGGLAIMPTVLRSSETEIRSSMRFPSGSDGQSRSYSGRQTGRRPRSARGSLT